MKPPCDHHSHYWQRDPLSGIDKCSTPLPDESRCIHAESAASAAAAAVQYEDEPIPNEDSAVEAVADGPSTLVEDTPRVVYNPFGLEPSSNDSQRSNEVYVELRNGDYCRSQ